MKIKQFDVILTKKGRRAVVLDIYNEGKTFLVEVQGEDVPEDEELVFVKLEDIEKITYVA